MDCCSLAPLSDWRLSRHIPVHGWRRVAVQNDARSDNLKVSRWVRSDHLAAAKGDSFEFARCSIAVNVPNPSLEQYCTYLEAEGWSFEETQYFLEQCRAYHLCFYIIADRYNYQDSKRRSIEELKERYFSLCKKIPKPEGEPFDGESFEYDRIADVMRKKRLERYYSRMQEQIEEDNFLLEQLRILSHEYPQLMHRREALLLLLAGDLFLSSPFILSAEEAAAKDTEGTKKRSGALGAAMSAPAALHSEQRQQKHRRASAYRASAASSTESNPFTEHDGLHVRRESKHAAGPHLRSSRLQSVRVGLSRHVDKVLLDMGLSIKPLVATSAAIEKFDELRDLIVQAADCKKLAEKAEADLKTVQQRIEDPRALGTPVRTSSTITNGTLSSVSTPGPTPGSPSASASGLHSHTHHGRGRVLAAERSSATSTPTPTPASIPMPSRTSAATSVSASASGHSHSHTPGVSHHPGTSVKSTQKRLRKH